MSSSSPAKQMVVIMEEGLLMVFLNLFCIYGALHCVLFKKVVKAVAGEVHNKCHLESAI